MPRMQILTPAEFNAFETPPAFSNVERQRFFDLSPRFEHLLSSFRTPTNRICFVLALGYFRATKRFFARHFREADAEYVTQQLAMLPGVFDLRISKETTARAHCNLILNYLGFQPFNTSARQHLVHEIYTLIRSQVRPKAMFLHALDVLARRKTEIPSAYLLTDLIVHEIRRYKGTLTEVIDAQISQELRALLETLLEKTDGAVETSPELQRFKLTLLKKMSQSTKPARIRATLEDWQTLQRLYDEITPMIATLDLTHDGIRYYANAVLKSQVFQVSRRTDEDRHLHLVCFIAHQFYRLQDALIDILLTTVQTALNACTRHHKEQYYAARTDQRRALVAFVDTVDKGALSPLQAIEVIVFNPALTDSEKVQGIQNVLTEGGPRRNAAQEQLVSFKTHAQQQLKAADYYDVLASQSRKLQNRVAEIIMALAFEGDEASDLMAAIAHYKAKDGQMTHAAPLGFLEPEEQEAVLDKAGDLRVSLYKALLFTKIAEALKGGALNLRHSYKYRSLDDYLIPKEDWEAHRHDYLQRVNLTAVADCEPTLHALAARLDAQYHQTNQHILAEENPHVHFRKA